MHVTDLGVRNGWNTLMRPGLLLRSYGAEIAGLEEGTSALILPEPCRNDHLAVP